MEGLTLSIPSDECIVLEFPGYAENASKALEMFGGAQVYIPRFPRLVGRGRVCLRGFLSLHVVVVFEGERYSI